MRLFLSRHHPGRSTYATETGQILYKANKPRKLSSTATISKAVGTIQGVWQGDSYELPGRGKESDSDDEGEEPGDGGNVDVGEGTPSRTIPSPAHEGHFAFYAQIEFNAFGPSKFRYDYIETPVKEYLRNDGWNWLGRRRVFTATDGKDYVWEKRIGHVLVLFRNDGSQIELVRYRKSRPDLGPLKGRQGVMKIDDSCKPILDEIIMTFIYVYTVEDK